MAKEKQKISHPQVSNKGEILNLHHVKLSLILCSSCGTMSYFTPSISMALFVKQRGEPMLGSWQKSNRVNELCPACFLFISQAQWTPIPEVKLSFSYSVYRVPGSPSPPAWASTPLQALYPSRAGWSVQGLLHHHGWCVMAPQLLVF